LRDALEHAGVTEEDIDTIIAAAKATRNEIVSR
jgi:3-oxoacyl-[acyl-carrier-protein] synthase III